MLTRVAVGLLLGVALAPLVAAVQRRWGRSRGVSAAIVGGALAAFFAAVVLLVAPPAVDQASQFSRELPATVRELYSWPVIGARLEKSDAAGDVEDAIDELPAKLDDKTLADLGERLLGGILSTVVVLITALGVLIDGERMVRRLRAIVPPSRQEQADGVGRIVYHSFGSYFAGSLLVAVLNGLVVLTVGLVLGVPLAPIAAIWSTLTNFIPQIGGFLGGSFFVLLALTESPLTAVIAGVVFLGYQQFENNVIGPAIVGNAVNLTPPATMLAALVGGAAAGVPGALVATPLIGAAKAHLPRPPRPAPAAAGAGPAAPAQGPPGQAPRPAPRLLTARRSSAASVRRRGAVGDAIAAPRSCIGAGLDPLGQGQGDGDRGAWARCAGEVDGAAVATDGGLDDGQAESAAAVVAAAGRVGPVEALEGPGGVGLGHARALVGHLEDGRRRPTRRTRTSIGAPGAWTSALPTRLATTWRRRASSPCTTIAPSASSVMSRSGATARASRAASSASATRSTGRAVGRPPLVESGQEEEVVDEAPHADGLLLGAAHGLVELVRILQRAGAVELGVAADRRDRRAQLVGRVGHELAQPTLRLGALVEGLLDAPEHLVQRGPELAGLGAGRGLVDPQGEVAGRDGRGGLGHPLHGSHAEADHPPGHEGEHGEDAGDGHDLHGHQAAHRVVDVVEAEGEHGHPAELALAPSHHAVAGVGVAPDGDGVARAQTRRSRPGSPAASGRCRRAGSGRTAS